MRAMGSEMLELIAFHSGGQEFCVDVKAVREIRGWTPATPLPDAPPHVKGVINLRGVVLPIIDLGGRLGMPSIDPTARHVIIMVEAVGRVAGLLVEAVSDIFTIATTRIQPAPEVADEFNRSFARGIIAIEGRMICLFKLESLFDTHESEAA